jgi:uncharacterized protein YndB with AHSA1/START domain|tara:strand:+ start:268 stop:627 length:360 start_codon:yes stop_codon:yes gene_type:complete
MPKFAVSKSIDISKPIEETYACVRDFRTWPTWSPWLITEPEAAMVYAPDGKSYSWDGAVVGSGEMELLSESHPKRLRYQLTFLKPWKSISAVSFHFESTEAGSRVTWTMNGSLPFFSFG